jgi:D-xylose reductase
MAGADESVLSQQIITQCAEKYNKTPAQIVLRWGIQRGCSVITKTTKTERLVENISIFDFELTASEMAEISALNKNRRFNDPGKFCESAFNTFYPIYD